MGKGSPGGSIGSKPDREALATMVAQLLEAGLGTSKNRTNLRGEGETKMRFLVMVKATKESEAGVMPSKQLLTDMGKFNEELVKAGIMQAGEGLHPSSKGVRVRFSGKNRTVIDGPFAETKELVAGFWLWETKSMQEAIEWVKKCPNPMEGESDIEIRQIFEPEELGAEFTEVMREYEERLRNAIASKKK